MSSLKFDTMVNSGHLYLRLAIFYSLQLNVVQVGISYNKRILPIKIVSADINIISFNVYLPCFSNSKDYIEKIAQCWRFIDSVLQDFMDNKSEMVVASDFNYSAYLFLENIRLIMLADLFSHNEVKLSDDLYIGDLCYTFKSENCNVYFWIDHILYPVVCLTKIPNFVLLITVIITRTIAF